MEVAPSRDQGESGACEPQQQRSCDGSPQRGRRDSQVRMPLQRGAFPDQRFELVVRSADVIRDLAAR